MSDLSIYELEDIIWDDFDHSGDHIVPHPTDGHGSEDKCEGDSCKKPRREGTPHQSDEVNLYASGSVCQLKEERDSKMLSEERNMMGEDSWSQTPDGVFAASGDTDSAKDMTIVQSCDTKLSNHCSKSSNAKTGSELCKEEGILKDTSGVVDSDSYNDLNLFSNDGDNKESSDLLYYGWPDIGNFEDVDRMLSNCDSSFGLGVTGNDDELVWFTSEDPVGGYEESLKMDLKFPCSEPSALTNVSQEHEAQESHNKASCFVSEINDDLKLKEQKEQLRQQNQTEGTKGDHCSGNYFLKSNDIRISLSDKRFTSIGNWQENKNLEIGSVDHNNQSSSYSHPGHDHVLMQSTAVSVMTGNNSENKASSEVHSIEGSSDPLSQGTASEISARKKVHHAHEYLPSFTGNQKQSGMMLASGHNLVSSQRQSDTLENKIESQSDMDGVKKGASADLDSTDVPEGSSISSDSDEISLEAITFRQLQQVMLQLDLRTKLCIRDSLYRLARSAEQRHNYAGISDNTKNSGAAGRSLLTEGTNKYAGLMDMETDTNPIDRTIAHLLFHRPSESSNAPTISSLPLKPNTKVLGSTACLPMVTEKPSCQQAEKESDDKISSSGKN